MSFTFKLLRTFSIAVLITALSAFALADTIKLKDGSVIKGKILSFANGQFVVLIGDGERQRQLVVFSDEIVSIEFDSSQVSAVNTDVTVSNTRVPNYSTEEEGNSTIITVGSASKTPNPKALPPGIADPPPTPVETPPSTAAGPIQIMVKVLADNTANGWTNAGWVVKKGQRIRILGSGRIALGAGRFSGPGGISTLPDERKLMPDSPTGSLIAVIGDDNNDFIFIGEDVDFVAERDGALFLGVNEGVLDDNSGSFEVMIEIDPSTGS